jgi:hypothetical protein
MTWTNKLNRKYTITTPQSKETIVNSFKERIEKANKETSWFTFNNINYKKIQVDDYRAIIKRNPIFYSPYGGIGFIILHFNAINGSTKIIADVKPVKYGIWVLIGFLIFISVLLLWLVPGISKYLMLIFVWIVVLTPAYFTIVVYRYRLKKYLELVLEDIGVQGELIRVLQ